VDSDEEMRRQLKILKLKQLELEEKKRKKEK
jgi:hypothetical protein